MTLSVSAEVGHSDVEVAEFLDHVKTIYITPADCVSNVFRYALPLGSIIVNMRGIVQTAFDNTPTVKVGDSTDDDGFFVTTDLDPQTIGSMKQSLLAGPEDGTSGVTTPAAFAEGKAYPTTTPLIVVTFSATSTVGKLRLDIVLAGRDEAPTRKDLINNF